MRGWQREPLGRNDVMFGAALAGAVVVLLLDYAIPFITLGPLMVLPVIAIAIAGGSRPAIALALVLSGGCAIVEPLSEHRPVGLAAAVNAAVFAIELIVAVALVRRWRFERATARGLSRAAEEVLSSAHQAFTTAQGNAAGWRFSTVRGAASTSSSAVDVRFRADGFDVFVTDVSTAGIRAAVALAALRGIFPSIEGRDPRARLLAQNDHLRPVCAPSGDCRAWDGRLGSGGAIRFASAGFAPALVVRASGRIEPTGGGGLPLGRFCEAYVVEGLAALDEGDALIVMDERMQALVERDATIVERLVAGDPGLRDDLCGRHGAEIGLAFVAHRVPVAVPAAAGAR